MCTVLSLSGCGPRLEIALRVGTDRPISMVALAGSKPRNELIVAAVDLVLRGAGISPGELTGVAASRGPGSFTGLRVTLATAQALALAHKLPGHGFSSLLVQAARATEPEVLAIQPARRGVVYAQPFSRVEHGLRPLEEAELVKTSSLSGFRLPVVGPEGLPFPADAPRATAPVSTAEALLALYDDLDEADPGTLVPLYLEPPAATPPSRVNQPWQRSPQEP